MPLLRFTLSEEGVHALRDALTCLAKFSDETTLEATKDRFVFTALNLSKSAYACVSFAPSRFFSRYHYEGTAQNRNKFFCKLLTRALLSVFRARAGDPLHEHEKDTTIERCDVVIEDAAEKNSRFIVKMICRNGMTTKYRLPFEVSPPVHAKFNKEEVTNRWSIASRTLKQLMDHFGPGTEFLDIINSDDDQTVNFTCFTDQVTNGAEVLKKPLHTSIAVEREEFELFDVTEDQVHAIISVKDFRAVIQHAALFKGNITALYSTATRPMQLAYQGDGLKCEFLLMTVSERGAPAQRAKKARANARAPRPQQLDAAPSRATSHAPTPAPQPTHVRQDHMPSLRPPALRPSQRPPPPTFEDDSLFVPMDNDNQWEPVNLNEDEDDEENARLGWNASAQPNPSALNMRSVVSQQEGGSNSVQGDEDSEQGPELSGLEPTQRLSDARKYSLFGD